MSSSSTPGSGPAGSGRPEGTQGGKPIGDPFLMPALFLVEGDRIVWRFVPDHLGGLPRFADIPRPVVV